jgi:hypothetical protein
MAAARSAPDDGPMDDKTLTPGWRRAAAEATDRAEGMPPVLLTVGAIAAVVVGLLVLGAVVSGIFSIIGLLLPVILVAIGIGLVSKSSRVGGSFLQRLAGWAAVGFGGLWLLDRLGIVDADGVTSLATLLFIRIPLVALLIAGAVYVGRAIARRR